MRPPQTYGKSWTLISKTLREHLITSMQKKKVLQTGQKLMTKIEFSRKPGKKTLTYKGNHSPALAKLLSWLEHHPMPQKFKGLSPSQGIQKVVCLIPRWGVYRKLPNDGSFSLSLNSLCLSFSLSLKSIKTMSEDFLIPLDCHWIF